MVGRPSYFALDNVADGIEFGRFIAGGAPYDFTLESLS